LKNISQLRNKLNRIFQVSVLAAVTVSIAVCAATLTASAAFQETPQYMFVQLSDDVKVNAAAKTFRLVNVNQQTLYFSDRPVRIAGHLKMADFLKEWTAQAGKDNFGEDSPNAVLPVYEPEQPDNTAAVVEITQPRIDGSDLIFSYNLIAGNLPASGGAITLFIDRIGIGGGVGPGFHGVGLRGPGL
jgi:hypothetical protein